MLVVIGACDKHSDVPTNQSMPVSEGFIGEKKVNVHRDTGFSHAAVSSNLVSDTQPTGDAHLCKLIDGTVQKFLIARVCMDAHYYKE